MNEEEKQEIKFVEVTWKRALKVYLKIWGIVLPYYILIGMVIFVGKPFPDYLVIIVMVVSIIVGLFFGIKGVLKRQYSDFRIALIEK